MTLRPVYIGHPLSATTRAGIERNRANASRWVAWLSREFPIAPVCSWITLSGEWDETPENRERGLEIDKALVRLCREFWGIGGRMSSGMLVESAVATVVHDLTGFGFDAPVGSSSGEGSARSVRECGRGCRCPRPQNDHDAGLPAEVGRRWQVMRHRTRGRRRRQRISLRRRFDRECDAFEVEIGKLRARLRAEGERAA